MGEYDPKSKRTLPLSWRVFQRKLPRTLNTFQVVILAGFLSLLILRSTVGLGKLGSLYTTPAHEYVKNVRSMLLDDKVDAEEDHKRTLVQADESDPVDKLQKITRSNAFKELEDEMDADITEQAVPKAKAGSGKDVKNVKEEVQKPAEKVVEKAAEKKKSVAKPKEVEPVVEDFDQVEAQLAEEETVEELADFENFEKSKEEDNVSSTKTKVATEKKKEQKVPSKENPVKKSVEKESSVEEIVDANEEVVPSKKQKPAKEKTSESKFVEPNYGKNHTQEAVEEAVEDSAVVEETVEEVEVVEVEESTTVKPVFGVIGPANNEYFEMSPERLKEFTDQAIANMTRIMRRDDPDAFTLGPKITNWDAQRASWLEKNPDMKTTDPHKPKVLLLTGSQPGPCISPVGDHYLLKMVKNKVDYARIHKMEIFYNFAHLEKEMSHFWAKLPLIRKMMLMRPEVEWIFWMDSDAMFTDMVFEIPFEKYEDYNFFMWGWEDGLFTKRSWVSVNTGVMFLRNNQWTLDLLEIWSHMGPKGEIRKEAGVLLSTYLTTRTELVADDQSALVFLMLTRPDLAAKIYLEDEYYLSGYWLDLVGKYEEFMKTSRPGAGSREWPFTTHFTGCQPCSGIMNELYKDNSCLNGMERAFNFADNQVLISFGFTHEGLLGPQVTRIRNETTKPVWSVPVDNPWSVKSFYE